MFGLPPSAVEWMAAGALLTALGALVKFAEWTFLLAGYDETSPLPKEVAADVAGSTVLRIGLAVFAFGVLAAMTTLPAYADTVLTVAIAFAVVRLLYRLNTYAPDTAEA